MKLYPVFVRQMFCTTNMIRNTEFFGGTYGKKQIATQEDFAKTYDVPKVYDQIDDVFTDPDVDVIYISTPHNTHIGYLRKALKSGKHVLCEKSITLNSAELSEAAELAREHHVVLAEAMTIYHMPIYRRAAGYRRLRPLPGPLVLLGDTGSDNLPGPLCPHRRG